MNAITQTYPKKTYQSKGLMKSKFKSLVSPFPDFTSQIIMISKNEKWIPDYQGVYFFHDLRGVYYVGETNNLKRRFQEHKISKRNTLLNQFIKTPIHTPYFSWIRTGGSICRIELEKEIVSFLKPKCNKIKFVTEEK